MIFCLFCSIGLSFGSKRTGRRRFQTNMDDSPFSTSDERQAERARKREAVLRAAVRMFNERGFHATSLDDVAASLGVSKPTIYHYLGNKEQVLFECVTRGLDQLRFAADEGRSHPGSGLDRLRSFLLSYAEIVMEDYGRCVSRTGEETLSQDSAAKFRALKREIHDELHGMVSEAVADGSIAPLDVQLTALTLAGALNWTARWHNYEGKKKAREVAEQLVGILTVGLAPRTVSRGKASPPPKAKRLTRPTPSKVTASRPARKKSSRQS
ncbi:MAG TPA: TetR/AcrR family transcriptional regulator [Hyphomonadaceae bacterium]|nr:TetR/AcrR family transcriptional regulator [Hyphomonadaceae bacterium]